MAVLPRSEIVLVPVLSIIICLIVESDAAHNFKGYSHGVESTEVKFPNDKQIQIEGFKYDGKGNKTWFAVGKGDAYKTEKGVAWSYENATLLPDKFGRCSIVEEYDGKKPLLLNIPDDLKVTMVDYLVLNNYELNETYGYVEMQGLSGIPAAPTDDVFPQFASCPYPRIREIPINPVPPSARPAPRFRGSVPANSAAFWLIVIPPTILPLLNI